MTRSRLTSLAVALALCGCKSQPAGPVAPGDEVTVTAVLKGDELKVTKGTHEATVRMLGIHAFSAVKYDPALENVGAQAKAWTQERLAGKTATLVAGKTKHDAFNRLLAYVTVNGEDQNRAMLAAGHAVVYTEYGFTREAEYFKAEANARSAKVGLWSNEAAVELVRSLRSLWSQNRTQRGDTAPADTWLAEVGVLEAAAPPTDLGDVPEPEIQ
jgi:endonuclease YncB( thermonuclease family)